MNNLELNKKKILFNALNEISKMDEYNKYKTGDIVKFEYKGYNKIEYGIYLIPTFTGLLGCKYIPLTKDLKLNKKISYIQEKSISNISEIVGFVNVEIDESLNYIIDIDGNSIRRTLF